MGNINLFEIMGHMGWFVRIISFLLIIASLASWAIVFSKLSQLKKASAENGSFLELFWKGASLDDVYDDSKKFDLSPIRNIFSPAFQEFKKVKHKSSEKSDSAHSSMVNVGLENVERSLRKAFRVESLKLESSLSWLATIASATPFLGLLGTVWGIMDSFMGLSKGGGASTIEKVGPGISEALIVTAFGLMVAIPAVIFYNQFLAKIKQQRTEMDGFSSDLINILKRNYIG